MPSTMTAPSAVPFPPEPALPGYGGSAAAQLAEACRALWLATLSLMTAFLQTQAPAHRCLLARRIAGNLRTLSGQPCFDEACRSTFTRLADRWTAQAEQYAPSETRSGGGREQGAQQTAAAR